MLVLRTLAEKQNIKIRNLGTFRFRFFYGVVSYKASHELR
jgi:hypothetical protein